MRAIIILKMANSMNMRTTISMKMINYWPMLNNNLRTSISSREPSTDVNVRKYYNHNSFNLAMLYSVFGGSLFYFRLDGSMFYEYY